jgi:hypothetical protein
MKTKYRMIDIAGPRAEIHELTSDSDFTLYRNIAASPLGLSGLQGCLTYTIIMSYS